MELKEIERQLKKQEAVAKNLEPDANLRSSWLNAVNDYAEGFLEEIDHRKAFETNSEEDAQKTQFNIPDEGSGIQEIIRQLEDVVDRPGLNPASGGHLGYIPGGGVYPSALGDYLAAVFNKYAGIFYAGPGPVKLENSMIRFMCRLVGFPESALGNLTSGGSVATLIAVTTARDKMQIQPEDIRKSVIYLTEQVHHSADKAVRIAGLEYAVIRRIPVDSHFRMDAELLDEQITADVQMDLKPFLIIASAGTTDTGAIDPLDKIAEITEKHKLWMHTDAAYGGFFMLSERLKPRFKGIERSDSITIDPHKGLFLPYGTGAVLIKDVPALSRSHFYTANYMQDKTETPAEPSPADLSPELTKHFRGLRMWLPLKLFGLNAFKAAAEEKQLLALYFREKVKALGFELGPEPDLSVTVYRYVPSGRDANAFNKALVECVKRDGRVFISSTLIHGQVWLRLALLSFRTHRQTIDTALEVLQQSVVLLSDGKDCC